MEPVRPSILNLRPRSVNSVSKCTQETSDEQYRREQDLLAAKAKRLQLSEQRLLNALYPTAEHIKTRQQEIWVMQEQVLAAQAEARQREQALEEQSIRRAQQESMDISHVRPWTAATIAYQSAEDEQLARRKFTHELAADNLKLMAERARQRQQQIAQETMQERHAIASERQFWNLGATNARWIAPEHRHLAPSPPRSARAMPEMTASAPVTPVSAPVNPPWATFDDTAQLPSRSLSSRTSASFSRSNSTGGQGLATAARAAIGVLQPRDYPFPAGVDHPRAQKKHVVQPSQQREGRPWDWHA